MGKIHVLPEHVANKIAAGEVVERPASVVKELLENSLDAGAKRIIIKVEAGGKKLIEIVDDGCGMVPDDSLLCFERHATSKLRNADDLLNISTLGFRGEALPSIASVSRLHLETRAAESASGTIVDIAGGKILKVEEAGLPQGTSISVRDLFFNTPARKKFLKSESTELSHIASLVTHYALAHPDMHFELHSSSNTMLMAPPVARHSERIFQVFGAETLDQLLPLAAMLKLERVGLPQPPPWRRDEDFEAPEPGEFKLTGFISKPEIQKLNRNSIFIFVNGRLIRDRLVQHALTEAYRNMMPPTVYPVVLLFLEMPYSEVDVNVHPSKTEVRFRQQTVVHDFVRDSVRAALMKARPIPQFTREIYAQPTAGVALTPGAHTLSPGSRDPREEAGELGITAAEVAGVATERDSAMGNGSDFSLCAPVPLARNETFQFDGSIDIHANSAIPVARFPIQQFPPMPNAGPAHAESAPTPVEASDATEIASLRPLGQIRDSFILAVNGDGLWIIDQHVAHERILFERVLKQRVAERVERQQMLMPLVIELSPQQQAIYTEISDELARNGFDVEPFGSRTIAVKAAPAGIDAASVEAMLQELLDQFRREEQAMNLDTVRHEIAASIACHAAIKVNTPLETNKMEWLLRELARTECPMSCPHGRPVMLRYSVRDIQKAFKRI